MHTGDKTLDLVQRLSSAVFRRVELEFRGVGEEELASALRLANPFGPDGASYWREYCSDLLYSRQLRGTKLGAA
jgi:hypothetical protein